MNPNQVFVFKGGTKMDIGFSVGEVAEEREVRFL